MGMRWRFAVLGLLAACTSLDGAGAKSEVPRTSAEAGAAGTGAAGTSAAAPTATATAAQPVQASFAAYPWLAGGAEGMPAPVDTLEQRIPAPEGFSRVPLAPGGFGAFLRGLPLAAKGTPVVSNRGAEVRATGHPNIAAVVAIDVGKGDLQQCADAVIRLHAEWRWGRGHRDQAYRSASGATLAFGRYAAGERVRVEGNRISLVPSARPAEATHALFRSWLDEVFGWTNTGALARDGERVGIEDLRPGDFFVLTGVPYGHTVLVLDMARDASGRRALLLGQSFVPAQSVQVLRPGRPGPGSAWFSLDEEARVLRTPFWEPFPFDSLRRLPE